MSVFDRKPLNTAAIYLGKVIGMRTIQGNLIKSEENV